MHGKKRTAKPIHGFISIASITMIMLLVIVGIGFDDPRLPLIGGCVIASFVSIYLGFSWENLINFIIEGISNSVEAILILMSIGILVGVWIASGTVPAMIFYGLQIISPRFFLPAAFIVCSLVSMIIGSWGSAGTIGIAFMGIGSAIGIDPAIIAGTIVAGAYVGDKLSPFSDGTNLAATVGGADVIEVIRQILPLMLVVYLVCVLGYTLLGFSLDTNSGSQIAETIDPLLAGLTDSFKISPVAFIPLLGMLVLIFFKIPALPSLLFGATIGAIQAVLMQGCSIKAILDYATNGYVSETGYTAIDELLSAGGLEAMLRTISIVLIAMAFGGIMQGSGQMEALVEPLTRKIHSLTGMVSLTVITCIGVNLLLPDQYLGIAVPGQMYKQEWDKRNLDRRMLSNTLGAGAAVTSPLVPWNTCGMYISSILGVATVRYIPYCFFNLLLPVAIILYSLIIRRKHFS